MNICPLNYRSAGASGSQHYFFLELSQEKTISNKSIKEATTIKVSERRMVQSSKPGLKNNQEINVENFYCV